MLRATGSTVGERISEIMATVLICYRHGDRDHRDGVVMITNDVIGTTITITDDDDHGHCADLCAQHEGCVHSMRAACTTWAARRVGGVQHDGGRRTAAVRAGLSARRTSCRIQ